LSRNTIGLVVKPNSVIAESIAVRITRVLAEHGADYAVEEESKTFYPSLARLPSFRLSDPPGKIIVVGGDGTLLRTVMLLGRPDPIIMTVRAGKRGFLLDVEPFEAEERTEDFINDNYRITEYTRLEVRPPEGKAKCVLNDAVFITKKAKLVSLSVDINSERAMNIDGDGVIVSSTVGSTAYSLSAGGPIIDPTLDVMVLTPLNPVQLHQRPLVVHINSRIDVEINHNSNPLYLVLDGQLSYDLVPGDVVSIVKCKHPARIARFKWWENYYEKLYSRIFSYI